MNHNIAITLPSELHNRLLRVIKILQADDAPLGLTDMNPIVIRELWGFVEGWEKTYGVTGYKGDLSDDQIAMACGYESLNAEAEDGDTPTL
jgi:hypothetical protein